MSTLDLTREWLQSVLRPYPARDRILPEVIDILAQRRTLSVKTDAFTFDSGHTALLLLLHGTLPITYRGTTYQIPVHIWIPIEYPRAPPIAFVVPTKEMAVRKGREVEPSGRVREEVVEEWWKGWRDKSVEMMIRQLISVFSVTPPVYARPGENGASPSGAREAQPIARSASGMNGSPVPAGPSTSAQPPPPPSRPSFLPSNMQAEALPQYRPAPNPPPHPDSLQSPTRQASGSYSQPPQPPNSPPIPHRPYQPRPQEIIQASTPTPHMTLPSLQGASAGPPGLSYIQQAGYSGSGQFQPQSNGYPPQTPQGPQQGPFDSQQPQYQQGPFAQSNHQQMYNPSIPQSQSSHNPQYNSAQAPYPPQIQSTPAPTQPTHRTQNVIPRQPQQDLLSSPEHSFSPLPTPLSNPLASLSSPPPVPPSKPPPPSTLHLHSILLPHLNASLSPLIQSLHTDRQHLIERHEDLVSGEPAIRDEMARLEAVKKVCDSGGRKMEDVVRRGEERVLELEGRGEVSVDEVVCGISIVHNQLIDLVAEDNAIEDTIYHMTRALDAERIDLDRFLKSIRSLAREQYMKRALIERILQGMGQTQGW